MYNFLNYQNKLKKSKKDNSVILVNYKSKLDKYLLLIQRTTYPISHTLYLRINGNKIFFNNRLFLYI